MRLGVPNWVRSKRSIVIVVVGALMLAALVLWGVISRDSDESPGEMVSPTSVVEDGEVPTAVPEDCEPGSGEWALNESLHGEEGRILNGGLPATTQAAVDVILAASRQDPLVLGQLLLDYGVEGVPSKEELRCVDTRREWWYRLDGIFQASEIEMGPLGDYLDELGIAASGGTVTVSNSIVVDGNVTIVESNVNVGENVLAVTPPGAAKPILHRSYCANVIVPPGEEVIVLPPGSVPAPVPTPPPPPGVTPTPPGATPTPPGATPTPPGATPTPTPTPPSTPTPTPTPPPPEPSFLCDGWREHGQLLPGDRFTRVQTIDATRTVTWTSKSVTPPSKHLRVIWETSRKLRLEVEEGAYLVVKATDIYGRVFTACSRWIPVSEEGATPAPTRTPAPVPTPPPTLDPTPQATPPDP